MTVKKRFNFCAGPAIIADEVLIKAQQSLFDFDGTGLSILSISHRDEKFTKIYDEIKSKLIQLLNIPDDYEVLIVSGGATQVFSMLPLNLGVKNKNALYISSGSWSIKAAKEASRFIDVKSIDASPELFEGGCVDASGFDYVHYTDNETIDGLQFQSEVYTETVPVCCDMSSSFLSKSINFNKLDLIYAGVQKNLGPAGACVVIGKKSLFGFADNIPSLLDFNIYLKSGSRYNTPVTFTWYIMNEVLSWIHQSGGIQSMLEISLKRSSILYDFIDGSSLYYSDVDHGYRSKMNVPFHMQDKSLYDKFLEEADTKGIYGLKGHKSVGGFRASLYNALSVDSVIFLVEFMSLFEKKYYA
jgi:phosphoserine aminotransferase